MTTKQTDASRWHRRALAPILVAVVVTLAAGPQALAQLPPLPPLPPPPALPPLLPPPPLDLSLAPPALPTIPSLPQILPSNAPGPSGSTELPVTSATLDAKLLIVSADGTEPVLGMIRQVADYAGIPYTLYIASRTPGGFTPAMLSDGNAHAYYQGIVLTTGTLAYLDGTNWTSAFSAAEWQTLWDYQARYRVRTVIAYAFPTADLGYGPPTGVDASTSPIPARLTATGRSVFPYVNGDANALTISRAWTYLAQPSGSGTNVLLSDPQNHALALVRTYPDGRQVLSLTFDGNFFLVHSLVLAHGLMNWVMGGLFVGERHVHLTPQIDDVFLDNDIYGGGTYRISGVDWTALDAWQAQKQLQAQTAGLRLHMAFNGEGTDGKYLFDTLTPVAGLTNSHFPWINHTYTHENLDAVGYEVAYREIERNHQKAASMGLSHYDRRALVTPDISGLSNPAAMRAAYDAGIRFLVTDTSRPGMDNPTPQAGIYNAHEPRILMVPRRPVNLFYNVSTPTEWRNEYNYLYRSFWGRDLSYSEILDKESDVLLQYMLRGEIDPWMFHQANLRAYDGVHSLLGDLLDRLLAKYSSLFTLPVRSLTLAELGEWTENRMRCNTAGIQGRIAPASGTLTLTAASAAVVPVTGLCGGSSEVYGGQCIGHVPLQAGETVTLSFEPTGEGAVADVPPPVGDAPAAAKLRPNSPNPFRTTTDIGFELPQPAQVSLRVFDAAGRLVRNIASGHMPAGAHVVRWDGRDAHGAPQAGGVYFCELRAGSHVTRRRMVLLR